jgi:hypothetical protein
MNKKDKFIEVIVNDFINTFVEFNDITYTVYPPNGDEYYITGDPYCYFNFYEDDVKWYKKEFRLDSNYRNYKPDTDVEEYFDTTLQRVFNERYGINNSDDEFMLWGMICDHLYKRLEEVQYD